MDVKLNHKIIKEVCGTVSFKKGDSFYRTGKVSFESYGPESCIAVVSGTEDFKVSIEKKMNGKFNSTCSCPKLVSFEKDCQHIAAVLLSICEHQNRGTSTSNLHESLDIHPVPDQGLTDGFITLFQKQPNRARKQLHFEKRLLLDVEFTCKLVTVGMGQYMLGIELRVGQSLVQDIRNFLKHLKDGTPILLSNSFSYNPSLHCFQLETDAVLGKLIDIVKDEQMYMDGLLDPSDTSIDKQVLLIPPSSWNSLCDSLENAKNVKLESPTQTYEGLRISTDPLDLKFIFDESAGVDFQLTIHELNRMAVLHSYQCVLYEGTLFRMDSDDCNRLYELKQMLNSSGTNLILIPNDQIESFLEKVVPGLRKLGEVQISEGITSQFLKTPLIAKLYLDRVKNRLLAGLEFHYENFVLNPLESRELKAGSMLVRDIEKEEAILRLMDDSMAVKTDGGYFLHNEELEYEFLYYIVPKIQKLAQIYVTTAVRNRIFRENPRPRIRVKVMKERTNWLEFKFEMDGIPEKHIREILLALEEKRKYFRLRNGSLLSLETKEFEEINRFLNAGPVQEDDLEKGLNLPLASGLQLLNSADAKAFSLEESLLEFLESIRNPESMDCEIPKSLEFILRDYQKVGYKWMKALASYGLGGILADDMGLGKTLQSITYILSELQDMRTRKLPALIVCPSSLTYNWLSELNKFAPDVQALIIDGTQKERVLLQKDVSDMNVLIVSYPLLRRDITWYEKQAFHTVFFDEAQAFKNPFTQTARAVKKIKANHRFALTGTPVENALEELWSIFHVVFPELFLGLKEFSNLSRDTIARRTRPFLLRRMKEDVLAELPEKIETSESMELLPDQKKLYAAYLSKLRHDTLKHLDKEGIRKNRIKILAGLTRLRQICCHPALFVDGYNGSSAKFEQLMDIIEESRLSGRRVLIFSQFTKMLELIGRELASQGLPFFYLDGKTPSNERVETCNRFNLGERDLFLISLKAGGTGLNLTGADTVILYDNWWNPAVEQQAADRAHRMGQKNIVQVIKLVARGTIEEKMNELQEKKRLLIEEIIDSDKHFSSALTEEDIREILMI
ncbi:DEAD/DEAH box helicase [Paenisporosarcina indica]|uniref:DEAD/DEAH box helicase n=1 Tax=Paenisporosarcina indica TaxID=650093 RepID=UPI00094F80E9|nr:DEAD/DEAH box helicase [Paenisporosarcina indica]